MALTYKPQAMIFDLDGTLAHTLPQLSLAVRKVAQEMGLPLPNDQTMSQFVGNGVTMLLGRVIMGRHDIDLAQVPQEKMQEARALFNRFYQEGLSRDFVVYPGVVEGLTYFHSCGIKLGVVTNKPNIFAQPLLGFMGLKPFFAQILGGEVLKERKPDPTPVLYVLDKMGADPQQSLMVGDSINDVKAGQNAHMVTVAFTYGYNGGYDLHTSCNPDYLFSRFDELTELIRSLPSRSA